MICEISMRRIGSWLIRDCRQEKDRNIKERYKLFARRLDSAILNDLKEPMKQYLARLNW